MLFRRRCRVRLETKRLYLRPPQMEDHAPWAHLRRSGRRFLEEWEPSWSADHLGRNAFRNRVVWARRAIDEGRGLPLFAFLREGDELVGAITVDNVRRGPAQMATVGYWIGESYARLGLMTEALFATRDYVFETMNLSRLEAACLKENLASRKLLERCGFEFEGVAKDYLQINGRWRNHVLYAALRADRRSAGRTHHN